MGADRQSAEHSLSWGPFRCLRLSILIEAENHILLPMYQGGALGGAFGHALKETACLLEEPRRDCGDCRLSDRCVYSYTFETPLPKDAKVLRNTPHVPHPFILHPMTEGEGTHLPGNQLRFGMTLTGRAIDHLPLYVDTFIQMGMRGLGRGRGGFRPRRVQALGPRGERREILFAGKDTAAPETILEYDDALRLAESCRPDRIAVTFNTPLRVKYQGRLAGSPDFHILIRNLIRRLSNLIYFHCGHLAELPFAEIIRSAEAVDLAENATRWLDWSRRSSRRNEILSMGGMVGRALYRGDLAVFLPMLAMGTWVNVGKGTALGLGSYRFS